MIDHGRLSRVKKLQVFSFGSIFLIIIFSFSFISNVSLHSVASETKRNLQELQTHKARQPLKLTSSPELHAVKEENPEAYTEDHAVKEDNPEAYTEDHDHLDRERTFMQPKRTENITLANGLTASEI
ncbi:unnamed protein product, partial [Ilex paraguariensis]